MHDCLVVSASLVTVILIYDAQIKQFHLAFRPFIEIYFYVVIFLRYSIYDFISIPVLMLTFSNNTVISFRRKLCGGGFEINRINSVSDPTNLDYRCCKNTCGYICNILHTLMKEI